MPPCVGQVWQHPDALCFLRVCGYVCDQARGAGGVTPYRTIVAGWLLRAACRVGGREWTLTTLLGPKP